MLRRVIAVSTDTSLATIAGVQDGIYDWGVDTGTANHYIVSLTPKPTVEAGLEVDFIAAHTNTGPSDLTLNSLTAVAITKNGTTVLAAGDIPAGEILRLKFDGTAYQIQVGTVTHSTGALALNAPVFGNAIDDVKVGTTQGNTTMMQAAKGPANLGYALVYDAYGNAVEGAGPPVTSPPYTNGLGAGDYMQIPNGPKNGSNKLFSLDYTVASAPTGTPPMVPIKLMVNGIMQSAYYPRYSLAPYSNQLVMIAPPQATDEFVIWYVPGSPGALLPPPVLPVPPPSRQPTGPLPTGPISTATLSMWAAFTLNSPNTSTTVGIPTVLTSLDSGVTWVDWASGFSGFFNSTTTPPWDQGGAFPQAFYSHTFDITSGFTLADFMVDATIGGTLLDTPCDDRLQLSDIQVTLNYANGAVQVIVPTAYSYSPGNGSYGNSISGDLGDPVLGATDAADTTPPLVYSYVSRSGYAGLATQNSLVFTTWTPVVAAVAFGTPDGTVLPDALQTVTLTAAAGSTIYYTTDGTTPTIHSTQYTTPVPIPFGLTIKAIAVSATGTISAVAQASYTIGASTPGASAGKALIAWLTSPATNSYTTAPSGGDISFMQAHIDRIIFYTPYGDTRNTWVPSWVYRDSSSLYNPQDTATVAANPAWVLRDASGNPLYINFQWNGTSYPQYQADYGLAAFRTWWIAQATLNLAAGYKGLFVDDVNMDFRVGSGGAAVIPVDPRTGAAMTQANWELYVVDFVEAVRAAFPSNEIVHNAIWYAAGGDPSSDPLLTRQILAADYFYLERGFNDPGLTGGTGQFALRTLLAFIDQIHGLARHFIAGQYSVAATDYYPLACYLLVSNGGDYFVPDSQTLTPPQFPVVDYANLGAALGPRYDWIAGSGSAGTPSVAAIYGDMTGINDAHPHGVPSGYDFYTGPVVNMGNSPAGNTALVWWGDLYVGPSGNPASNTWINIKSATLFWMRASTGVWTTVNLAAGDFGGGYYSEDFLTDLGIPVTFRAESDGSFSFGTVSGRVAHIYAPFPRIPIPATDMGGIVVVCDAQLILDVALGTDDRASASLLLGVGADYYPGVTGPGITSNPGVGGGKFKYVTETEKSFAMTTMTLAQLQSNPPPGSTGSGGIMRRDFVNGSVFVAEPGGGGGGPIAGTWTDPLGNTVTNISLAGGTGMILTGTTSTGVVHTAPSTADSVYPSGVVDVTAHGAVGDGTTDNTSALQAAMNYCWSNGYNVLYFPSGTYLISGQLIWKDTGGTWRAYLAFWGQNQATTTLKLANGSSGFGNSTGSPVYTTGTINAKGMLYMASEAASDPYGGGEAAFYNGVQDMTLDLGSGNPGAQGIDYVASNMGSIRNVSIIGAGRVGLNISRGAGGGGSGPSLVKNLTVSGAIDYGVINGSGEVGTTFEHIFITAPNVVAFLNQDQNTWVRDLNVTVSNSAQPVTNGGNGNLTLIDSTFAGTGSAAASSNAITNAAFLFARNISTTGFAAAIAGGGRNISEVNSLGTLSLFSSQPLSLNLPVVETPDYLRDNDFSHWTTVTSGGGDRTADIQAALNAGQPIVFIQPGAYAVSGTLTVPSGIRRIQGLFSELVGSCVIHFVGTTGASVDLRTLAFSSGVTFLNAAGVPLVLADVYNASGYENTPGLGQTVFFENAAIPGTIIQHGGNAYARQFDIESDQTKVINDGATFWCLGYKTEGTGAGGTGQGLWYTENGGATEILGAFNSTPGAGGYLGYYTVNSQCSIAGLSSGSFRTVIITETRGGTTLTYSNIANRYGGTAVTLYSGRP